MEDYSLNIGKRVTKCRINPDNGKNYNPNPFKSGFKTNTVKGVIDHPILHVPAYTFIEDDSYVECRRCKVVELTEQQNRFIKFFENSDRIISVSHNKNLGKTTYIPIQKAKRTPKLTQFQIDMLVSLYEGMFFNATAYKTISILESRGLIEGTPDKHSRFKNYTITNKGIDELKLVRPL